MFFPVLTRQLAGSQQVNNHSDDSGDERYRGRSAQTEADNIVHIAQCQKKNYNNLQLN